MTIIGKVLLLTSIILNTLKLNLIINIMIKTMIINYMSIKIYLFYIE